MIHRACVCQKHWPGANQFSFALRPRREPGLLCAVLKFRSGAKYWLPALLWMALIFAASADSKSVQHSSRLLGPFLHWLFPQMSAATVGEIVFQIRKGAHFTEFAVLAGLFWFALRQPRRGDQRPWSGCTARNAWLLATACAISDELHQRFVPGRQAAFVDVVIDSAGAAAGLILLWALGRWRKLW